MPDDCMVKKQLYSFKKMAILLLIQFFAMDGYAQCGSSGDPIVNITFGTIDNPAFGEGRTTYGHFPHGQNPQGEGWYREVTNVNMGLPTWKNLRDHTGDPGGLMLVFNADYEPGEFYRIRVSGLCENTRFNFSAWIAHANTPQECGGNPMPAKVRFVIEDSDGNAVNVPYDTGDIWATSSPVWNNYGFEFDTGNQTEFDLVLINDNPGGCGNDLAIDDIQFMPCGPPISLTMDETLRQRDTLFFCDNATEPIVLNGSIAVDDSYATDPVFQWQSRDGADGEWEDIDDERGDQLSIVPLHNRWYRLTAAASADNLTEPLCRISSEPVRIAQIARQTDAVDIDKMDPMCGGGGILLNPLEYTRADAGPLTYQWQLDNGGTGAVDIPDANSVTYEFHPTAMGVVHLRRQAVNVCGDRFVTHTFEIDVQETMRTAFTLLQSELCADDNPLPLSGGEILNGTPEVVGVYSGTGVVDGVFYPAIAGVGQHTVIFSPPSYVLCQLPSQATITVHDTVRLQPMQNVIMLRGQTITLRPQTDASHFSWSNEPGLDNYQTQFPVASPAETTTYTLTARNAFGCGQVESVTITVLDDLVVPNGFTPNNDGYNDAWEIKGLDNYPNVFLQVFNRWGTLVYSSRGYTAPWNGQLNGAPLPTGTYYYTLSSDVLIQPLSGSVAILR